MITSSAISRLCSDYSDHEELMAKKRKWSPSIFMDHFPPRLYDSYIWIRLLQSFLHTILHALNPASFFTLCLKKDGKSSKERIHEVIKRSFLDVLQMNLFTFTDGL